jgi:hypothetical protein
LYNINVPPLEGNEIPRTYWTTVLQNCWTLASIYRVVNESKSTSQDDIGDLKSIEWAPQRQEQLRYIEESQEPTDAWALKMGYIRYAILQYYGRSIVNIWHQSVTPLLAVYGEAPGLVGGITFSDNPDNDSKSSRHCSAYT